MVGVFGAVAALVLAAILVAVALQTTGDNGGGAVAGPTTAGADNSSPPPDTSSPTAAPQTRDEIVAALSQQIDNAVASGSLDPDAADELRDRLSDMQKGNSRKRAADLRKKINDMLDDDEVSQPVADQLLQLLQPLTASRGGDQGDQ
jgi:polyhydroxyalkanoate synthesis regulator phasin